MAAASIHKSLDFKGSVGAARGVSEEEDDDDHDDDDDDDGDEDEEKEAEAGVGDLGDSEVCWICEPRYFYLMSRLAPIETHWAGRARQLGREAKEKGKGQIVWFSMLSRLERLNQIFA
nr:hypothetical protein TPOLY_g4 [Trichoderma polysporum]